MELDSVDNTWHRLGLIPSIALVIRLLINSLMIPLVEWTFNLSVKRKLSSTTYLALLDQGFRSFHLAVQLLFSFNLLACRELDDIFIGIAEELHAVIGVSGL